MRAGVAPRCVLLVDDDLATVTLLTARLRRAGFEVHRADHVERAAFLLTHLRFSVVVTDLNLTGGFDFSGLDLCQHVRRSHPGTRMLLLTGTTARRVEHEARRLGVNAILYKPCPSAQVVALVEQLAGTRGSLPFEAGTAPAWGLRAPTALCRPTLEATRGPIGRAATRDLTPVG
jgi:DNA-binding response OmpR family regulator